MAPDYSPVAKQYAASRPTYPDALFAGLAALVEPRRLAWDCATGSGQAAIGLAAHFERVIGTDISAEQIRHAIQHERITYRVAGAEASGLEKWEADLVTVASALHWLDLERFYNEVRRVLRPGGVLAVWSYHIGHMAPPFDALFLSFYRDVLAPHFDPRTRVVDDGYAGVMLPGAPIEFPELQVTASWTLERMKMFIGSWSGVMAYREAIGEDPLAVIEKDLEALWGPPDRVRTLRWPLYARVSRL